MLFQLPPESQTGSFGKWAQWLSVSHGTQANLEDNGDVEICFYFFCFFVGIKVIEKKSKLSKTQKTKKQPNFDQNSNESRDN